MLLVRTQDLRDWQEDIVASGAPGALGVARQSRLLRRARPAIPRGTARSVSRSAVLCGLIMLIAMWHDVSLPYGCGALGVALPDTRWAYRPECQARYGMAGSVNDKSGEETEEQDYQQCCRTVMQGLLKTGVLMRTYHWSNTTLVGKPELDRGRRSIACKCVCRDVRQGRPQAGGYATRIRPLRTVMIACAFKASA